MASKQDKIALKENGHIVMEALRNIDQNPTLLNLTRYIASTYKTPEDRVKEPLKKVLESGMDLGLISRLKGKYFLYGEETEEVETETEVADAGGKRRRRKRSTSRKRKSRSRSKRRRRSR